MALFGWIMVLCGIRYLLAVIIGRPPPGQQIGKPSAREERDPGWRRPHPRTLVGRDDCDCDYDYDCEIGGEDGDGDSGRGWGDILMIMVVML